MSPVLNPGFLRPPTPFRPVDVIPGNLAGTIVGRPGAAAQFDAHSNFAYSTIATPPSPPVSDRTLTVQPGDGALFPVAPFNATVWPSSGSPLRTNAEIVRVCAVVGDVLTIDRGQEGSTSRSILAGDQIAATITAKTLTDIESGALPLARLATQPVYGAYRKTTPRAVSGTVAATDLLNGEFTIGPGVLAPTGMVRLTALGDYLNSVGTVASQRFQLLFGGVTLFDTGAGPNIATSGSRGGWKIVVEILNTAAGAQVCFFKYDNLAVNTSANANTAFTVGNGEIVGTANGIISAFATTAAALDTTSSKTLVLYVINGSSSASYETKLLGALLEIIN